MLTPNHASNAIAQTIRDEYPDEQLPEELAEQLAAWAMLKPARIHAVVAWIRDRPRHPLSMSHLADWARRYNLQA